jgi:hypothetical protein
MLEGIGHFDHARYGFCIVHLCHGKLEGRDFFAFVAIEPQNYLFFKKHYRAGINTTGFEAYGRELLRGWGEMPHGDIIKHVSRKHKIDFVNGPHATDLAGIPEEVSPFLHHVKVTEAS